MSGFDFPNRALDFDLKAAVPLALAAQAAYLDEEGVRSFATEHGFPFSHFFDVEGTQAFVIAGEEKIVVAFRGTEPGAIEDIATDLRVRKIGGPLGGRVHRGFLMALLQVWDDDSKGFTGIESVIRAMKKKYPSASLWVTGHSLGAALATLAAAFLTEEGFPVQGLYIFGCPRVGDADFVMRLDARCSRNFRVVNNNDVVTRVPPRSFGYDHAGKFVYLSEGGDVSCDPSDWYVFLDRALGRLCDIGETGTDGVKDHKMAGYIETLSAALEAD